MNENITLYGYNSKKQSFIYLIVSIIVIIVSIFCIFFAEEDKKYASIPLFLIGIGFFAGFIHLLKQQEIAFKVIDDRYIYFYDNGTEKMFDLYDINKVHYWKANFGLKITIIASNKREHLTYLLKDAKNVKNKLLQLFEKYNIKVINRYSK